MFKTVLTLVVLLTAVFVFAGGDGTHEKLPPAEYSAKMQAEPGVILDVRTPDEFKAGHVEGAENINFYDEDFASRIGAKDKEKTYYIYCRSGGRSGKTLDMMKKAGFKKVFDMKGGMIAWNAANMPTKK